jgi:hypothetical protein
MVGPTLVDIRERVEVSAVDGGLQFMLGTADTTDRDGLVRAPIDGAV